MAKTTQQHTVSLAEQQASEAAAQAQARAEALANAKAALLSAYADASEGLDFLAEADLLAELIYGVDIDTRMRALNRATYSVALDSTGKPIVNGEAVEAEYFLGGMEYTATKEAGKPEVRTVAKTVKLYDREGKFIRDYTAYDSTADSLDDSLKNAKLNLGNAARAIADHANVVKAEQEAAPTRQRTTTTAKSAEVAALEARIGGMETMLAEALAALKAK